MIVILSFSLLELFFFFVERPAPLICINHIDWKPTLLLERETVTPIMNEVEEDPFNVAGISLDRISIEMAFPSELPDIIKALSSHQVLPAAIVFQKCKC